MKTIYTLPQPILIFINILAAVILLIIFISILFAIINKRKMKAMYSDIEKLFNNIALNDIENTKLVKNTNKDTMKIYDYNFITKNYNYYIKVVPNFQNEEICVNNATRWQLRKSFNDESMRFVQDIDYLMRMNLIHENGKISKKLYVIYKNARTLLKYINECEMEFVHHDTDVYGTNIVTYSNIIEIQHVIKL